MPLQKLRMKHKVSYLKNNYTKANEEIKANLKKKINNYQEIMKNNIKKKKLMEPDQAPPVEKKTHYRIASSKLTLQL